MATLPRQPVGSVRSGLRSSESGDVESALMGSPQSSGIVEPIKNTSFTEPQVAHSSWTPNILDHLGGPGRSIVSTLMFGDAGLSEWAGPLNWSDHKKTWADIFQRNFERLVLMIDKARPDGLSDDQIMNWLQSKRNESIKEVGDNIEGATAMGNSVLAEDLRSKRSWLRSGAAFDFFRVTVFDIIRAAVSEGGDETKEAAAQFLAHLDKFVKCSTDKEKFMDQVKKMAK